MSIFDDNKSRDPAAMFVTCSRAVVVATRELLELEAQGKVSGRTRLRLAWTVADYEDAARELSFEELPSGVKDDLWMAGRFASTIGKASRKPPEERDVNAARLASAADSLEQSAAEILRQINDGGEVAEERPRRGFFGRRK